jgi:sec-independent protein translocase protein TatA
LNGFWYFIVVYNERAALKVIKGVVFLHYKIKLINMISIVHLFSLPGGMEWVLIFLAVLLLFGGRKIPELMKGIGKGIREFNDAKDKVKDELEEGMKEDEKDSGKQDKNTSNTESENSKTTGS